MLKAILFFTLLLPSVFSFATDTTIAAATPKPITLTFFELTNKLTATHKKQLDKVAGFLKKNKEYSITIAGTFDGDTKFTLISRLKIEHIEKYLVKKCNLNPNRIDNGFDIGINNHDIKIKFYKPNIDSINKYKFYEKDSTIILLFEGQHYLTNNLKYQLDALALYLSINNNINIKMSLACYESNYAMISADKRLEIIERYLISIKKIKMERIETEKNIDLEEGTLLITQIKNELN